MEVGFPLYIDTAAGGLTAAGNYEAHIRQMIEQLIFTAPGERVNRPDFGCGLAQLVFAAASDQLIAVTQATVQAELQRWLGDVIQVETVTINREEAKLVITLQYVVLRSGQLQEEQFTWNS